MKTGRKLISLSIFVLVCLGLSSNVYAIPVSINFSGGQLNVVGEYINAVKVASAQEEFAPLFQSGQTISGSISYDTNQPDTDPGPYGTYRIGALSVNILELGLSASRSSNNMQISAFNNTPNPDDQFFAYVNDVDSFSSNIGIPNPSSFSVLLFGDTNMLSDDQLPTNQLDWTFGNVSFNFLASDNSWRQVLMTFTPSSVPEPTTMLLFGTGLAGIAGVRLRRRNK